MATNPTILITYFLVCLAVEASKGTWNIPAAQKQAAFLKTLHTYDIVNPAIIDENGNHVTRDLREIHTPRRYRRELSTRNAIDLPTKLYMSVNVSRTEKLNLNLSHNSDFLSKGFLIERRGRNLSEAELSRPSKIHKCHYRGHVFHNEGAKVALTVCSGLRGIIWFGEDEYFIEPLLTHATKPSRSHPHVIYKRSAVPGGEDPPLYTAATNIIQNEVENNRPINQNLCGVTAQSEDYARVERVEDEQEGEVENHHRRKRSISRERFVETLVVVDHNMYQYYHDQNVETYALTIMNMVTALYHDASLGNLVNIVLVRLLILTEEEESLNITHNAKNTLTDFCRWQNDFNDVGDVHPHHHDTALLFTRKDICLDMNQPCATLGLAHVSGMCERHRSCTINEDSGLGMAYTVAHEMGHLFGMDHDGGAQNDCKYPEPGTSQLMASRLDVHFGPMKWSRCSRDYISRFLDRGWGDCLLDEPSPHNFNFPHLPAGVMYSADYQCKLLFKRNSTLCTRSSIQHGICTTLWCQVEHACHSKTTPAAPGTACGQGKWCYNGKCVTISEPPQPIPGGWGEWGEWSQCSRTCGGGVMIQERHCNNPAPANGGRYCEGKRKNYALCKVQACPKGSAGFRALQCSRYNNKVYQGYYYHWLPVIVPGNECKLSCEAAGYSFAAEKSPMVDDGTPCGERSKDICINGICYRVGCDNRIGSNAVEDICGVCHGDGSSCTQITNGFNNTVRSPGLFRITVIPVAARSISIEEKSESSNYIDLQDMNGRSIFNSYSYQREGEYTVDDEISTVTYRIRGSMEKVTIKGPLTKPINIVCNIRTRTPNIEYRYYLPKSINESSSVPTTFEWKRDEWTPCSTTCGNGTQRSIVRCVGMMEGVVDDSYCEGSKPDDKQRSCNEHTCPASWWVGPWQSCSVSCGEGVQKRSVFCIRSLSSDEQMAISDATCIQHGAEAKPATALTCSNYACPSERDWRVGNWSECSSSCGEGTQQRDVECKRPDNRCAHEYRPAAEQACTTDCQYYFYSSIEEEYSLDNDYNPTMSSALYSADYTYQGVQRNTFGGWESEEARKKDRRSELLRERKEEKNRQKSVTENNEVSIDSEAFMREDARIDEERNIVNGERTGLHDSNTFILKEWRSGSWSQCSVTCGSGSRTRSVLCVNSVTSTPLAGCSPDSRPSAEETCQLTVCPPTDPDCVDKLDISYCRIAKVSGRCSLPAFMKVCCATCGGR